MIEDKKLGVKWAESEEEAEWYGALEDLKQSIEMLKMRKTRAERDLKLKDREIIMRFRNGAKAVIKQAKNKIEIQKELMKFVETKIKNV